MNETVIIATYAVINEVLQQAGQTDHRLSQVSDAEVLTITVVAALYLHNHQERALCMMRLSGYVPGQLSVSRYNRRLHALREWLGVLLAWLGRCSMGHRCISSTACSSPSATECALGAAAK